MLGAAGSEAFFGRNAEIGRVVAAAGAAAAGRPQVVVIEGDAGIGKSALLSHALDRLDGFGRVLVVGEEAEKDLGLAALAMAATALSPQLLDDLAIFGAGAVPESAGLAIGLETATLLTRLSTDAPVVLAVEDAHWVDSPSARALQFALRRLRSVRLLTVITTRPGTRPEDRAWSGLAGGVGGTRLRLGPLPPADLGQLANSVLGRPLPPAAVRRLHEHTGGHPLHARLLLVELTPWQLVSSTGPLPAPRSLAAAVLGHLSAVSAPARELVVAVAVLGGTPAPALAAAVADVAQAAALEEASAAGLLEEVDGPAGRGVRTSHPLIAAAVVEDLSPTRRRDVHLRALGFVSGEAALRHQVAAADGPDEDLAVILEVTAARHEVAGEPERAAARYLAAAELSATGAGRERRFLNGVGAILTAGDLARGFELAPAIQACSPGPGRSMLLAVLAVASGRFDEAKRLLDEARAASVRAARPAAAQALLAATVETLAHANVPPDVQTAVEAVLARTDLPPTWLMLTRMLRAIGLGQAGRVTEALSELGDVGDAATVPTDRLALVAARGALRLWAGDEHHAATDLRTVDARLRAGEPMSWFGPFALGFLAEVEYRLGRWREADEMAATALAIAEAEGRRLALPLIGAVSTMVAAERGEWSVAEAQLEAARSWSASIASPANVVYVALCGAVLARARGDPEAMLASLRPALDSGASFRRRECLVLHAEALIRLGRSAEAEAAVEQAFGEAPDRQPRRVDADAWLVRTEMALTRADVAAGRRFLAAAQTVADGLGGGGPFLQGRLALAHGTVLLAGRYPAAGVARLGEARDLFASLGARPWRARCEEALAHAGGKGAGGLGLTARELEVAQAVARGLSNPEAAAVLFVSRKTIEHHLGRIYTKLGVVSRDQLAARLRSVTLAPGSPPEYLL